MLIFDQIRDRGILVQRAKELGIWVYRPIPDIMHVIIIF